MNKNSTQTQKYEKLNSTWSGYDLYLLAKEANNFFVSA